MGGHTDKQTLQLLFKPQMASWLDDGKCVVKSKSILIIEPSIGPIQCYIQLYFVKYNTTLDKTRKKEEDVIHEYIYLYCNIM